MSLKEYGIGLSSNDTEEKEVGLINYKLGIVCNSDYVNYYKLVFVKLNDDLVFCNLWLIN